MGFSDPIQWAIILMKELYFGSIISRHNEDYGLFFYGDIRYLNNGNFHYNKIIKIWDDIQNHYRWLNFQSFENKKTCTQRIKII